MNGPVDDASASTAVTDPRPPTRRPAKGPSAKGSSAKEPSAKRPTPRPPRARSRRWLVVLILLATLGAGAGAAWALLDSGLFAVRSVIVTGTRLVPDSEVIAVADVKPGTPLLRVNTARIAARVLTIRQVVAVHVATSWPDRVVITVRERTSALAVALPDGGFDLIDANGVVVQSAATRPPGFPLYTTTAAVSSLRDDPGVSAAAAVIATLPATLRSSVTSVTAPSPDQVTLRLSSGVTIVWGSPGDAAAKIKELAILMQTHARYYDVSAPATAVTN